MRRLWPVICALSMGAACALRGHRASNSQLAEQPPAAKVSIADRGAVELHTYRASWALFEAPNRLVLLDLATGQRVWTRAVPQGWYLLGEQPQSVQVAFTDGDLKAFDEHGREILIPAEPTSPYRLEYGVDRILFREQASGAVVAMIENGGGELGHTVVAQAHDRRDHYVLMDDAGKRLRVFTLTSAGD